ncbi:MAG: hypothetical protein JWM77_3008 [Rhodospirillales bacterium]|nr:hypothetical protein [Rhodospirillales bacterium]
MTEPPKKTIRARLRAAGRVIAITVGVCLLLEFLPLDLALIVVTFGLAQLGLIFQRLRVRARPASPP